MLRRTTVTLALRSIGMFLRRRGRTLRVTRCRRPCRGWWFLDRARSSVGALLVRPWISRVASDRSGDAPIREMDWVLPAVGEGRTKRSSLRSRDRTNSLALFCGPWYRRRRRRLLGRDRRWDRSVDDYLRVGLGCLLLLTLLS